MVFFFIFQISSGRRARGEHIIVTSDKFETSQGVLEARRRNRWDKGTKQTRPRASQLTKWNNYGKRDTRKSRPRLTAKY